MPRSKVWAAATFYRSMSRRHTATSASGAVVLFGLLLALTSCTQGIGPADSLAPATSPFSGGGEAERDIEWWRAFEDPQLNRLIDDALDNNPNLQSIWERLQASEVDYSE